MSQAARSRDPALYVTSRDALDVSLERSLALFAGAMALALTTHSLHLLSTEAVEVGMVERATSRDSPIYLGLFLVQGGVFAVLLGLRILTGRITLAMMLAILSCLFVVASTIWSSGPSTTLFNSLVLSNQIVAAYVLAVHLPVKSFLRLFFHVCATIIVASFLLLAAAPELSGSARYGGGWLTDLEFSGVMASKNHAGYVFAATAILALHGRLIGIGGFTRAVVGGLAVVGVLLSNSATASVALIAVGATSVGARWLGPGRYKALFALQLVLVAAVFLVPFVDLGALTGTLGRDETFTGRTDLWEVAFAAFADRPLLGHGYYGFFDSGAYSPAWTLWRNFLYFFTGTFHNSAVDTGVSLGLVGLVLLAGLCVGAGLIAFRRSVDQASRLLAMSLLAVYTIGSTMELAILHHNHVATILAFYLLFVVAGEGDGARGPGWSPATADG